MSSFGKNMLAKLNLLILVAFIGQAVAGAKAKEGNPETPAEPACESPRLKKECEAGDIVFRTELEKNKEGCEEDCRRVKGCQSFVRTDDHYDCLLLKVKGKSTKAVGLPGPDYELKVPEPKKAQVGRSRKSKATWADCVEFHFNKCDTEREGGGALQWSEAKEFGNERKCIENSCQNEPQKRCKSVITEYTRRADNSECFLSSGAPKTTVNAFCGAHWGKVNKGPDSQKELDECLGAKIKCMRGYCDLADKFDFIPTGGPKYAPTEKNCKDQCWAHQHPSGRECTHYEYRTDVGSTRQRCVFFMRKPNTTEETNYKCKRYAAYTDRFGLDPKTELTLEELGGCKSGGAKYYKPTEDCKEMCKATTGDETMLKFPIAMAIDTTGSQISHRENLFKLIDQLHADKGSSYRLVSYGSEKAQLFPQRTTYAEFKKDLDSLTFEGTDQFDFFTKGLKVMCDNAVERSFMVASVDEKTNNLELEAEITKCLVDKRATLFIVMNPGVNNSTDDNNSEAAYKRVAEASGGQLISINNDVSPLVEAMKVAMTTICQCIIYDLPGFQNDGPAPARKTQQFKADFKLSGSIHAIDKKEKE